jgi:putative ABC transport system substrate-binding protein
LHRATQSIPIVTASCGYPIEAGLADSLSQPGKNVTGNSQFAGTQVWGKLLQLLREVKSGVTRVGVLWTYLPPTIQQEEIAPCYAELRDAERSLGLTLHFIEVGSADHVADALAAINAMRPDGLLLTSGLSFKANSTVMQFAVSKRLPTITDISWPNVQPPPLLSYGPVYAELVRSNVAYIDKIMKGAKPNHLPFQQPSKFELIVNLRTAKAIGITIPQEMFLRADSVVD